MYYQGAEAAADIERIVSSGFLTIEGRHQFDDNLRVLRTYYQLRDFYDALAVTPKPLIVPHSSMRALARNGAVIGINFGEGFVNPKDAGDLAVGERH